MVSNLFVDPDKWVLHFKGQLDQPCTLKLANLKKKCYKMAQNRYFGEISNYAESEKNFFISRRRIHYKPKTDVFIAY